MEKKERFCSDIKGRVEDVIKEYLSCCYYYYLSYLTLTRRIFCGKSEREDTETNWAVCSFLILLLARFNYYFLPKFLNSGFFKKGIGRMY